MNVTRIRWSICWSLSVMSCSAPPTQAPEEAVMRKGGSVATARSRLLEARAAQGGVADLISDEGGTGDDIDTWGNRRREFVIALAGRYQDVLAASNDLSEKSRRRDFAFEMLLEEWNPVGYTEDDIIQVMGRPIDAANESFKNGSTLKRLRYAWGSLRGAGLVVTVKDGRVVGLERSWGFG